MRIRRAAAALELDAWRAALAALVAFRIAIPLAALAAQGEKLPALPRYDYVGLTGDATGFYAAAREFMAAWGRLPPAVVAALAVALLGAGEWRRRPARRVWVVVAAALAFALVVTLGVTRMEPSGAAVFGWSLVWSLPMLPYRAVGLPLDADVAFVFGLVLSLAANAVTLVATAYVGVYASGRRAVGLAAATLYAVWPVMTGTIAGRRAWENGTWAVDAGLHIYTEPLSTALVTVALALLLRPAATPLALAFAGAALGLATVVKLSNGLLAAIAAVVALVRVGPRAALPLVAAGAAFVPVSLAYWPLGYEQLFDNPQSWPRDPFSPDYLDSSWTDSLLFTPRTLLVLLPLAVVGALALRRRLAVATLAAWLLVTAGFYSFFANTALHPRFLFACLPALFVLQAAGAAALLDAVRTVQPALRSRTASRA